MTRRTAIVAATIGLALTPVAALAADPIVVHLATATTTVPWDLTTWSPPHMNFERLLCDGLYDYSDAIGSLTTPVPAIADGAPTTTATTITVAVRQGLHFSDGTPVTPDDVKGSLLRAVDFQARPDQANGYPYYYDVIEGITEFSFGIPTPAPSITTDATHVTLGLYAQDAAFAHALAWVPSCVVPAATSHAHTDVAPVSTGPYRIGSQTPTQVVLERNPYWLGMGGNAEVFGRAADAATLWQPDSFVVDLGVTPAAQLSRMQAGTLDASLDDSVTDPGANATFVGGRVRSKDQVVSFLEMNTFVGALKNRQLRRAVSFALDRTRLARLNGSGAAPWSNLLAPDTAGAGPYPLTADLKRARAAVKAAKLKRLPTITIIVDKGSVRVKLAGEIKAELKKVGLTVTVKAVSYPYLALVNPKSWSMLFYGWGADFPDTSEVVRQELSRTGAEDFSLYAGADAPLQTIAAMPLGPARETAVRKLVQTMLANDAPIAPLFTFLATHVWTKRLANVTYVPTMGIRWSRVTVVP